MSSIEKIDPNFLVKASVDKDDVKFYDAEGAPFKIYGIFREGDEFRRMPENVAKSVSPGVYYGHTSTAGGRVRFKTDSKYVAIYAQMGNLGKMPHFALSGSLGFDMYADNTYIKSFIPPFDVEGEFSGVIDLDGNGLRDIVINFPLYSSVKKLYIGISENARLEAGDSYCNDKPVVYYGSSITQGGCASRPGMSYQAIVSREFNCDYINLGFSGNAKAEDEIIDYIKNLDMSVFVYDYDHNAPNVEHLRNTHEKMFNAIRNAHPDIPIIVMSRPKNILDDTEVERRNVIETTCKNARAAGDNNVYFVDGKMLTEFCGNEGTVDGTHPTDFGFVSMANTVIKIFSDNSII